MMICPRGTQWSCFMLSTMPQTWECRCSRTIASSAPGVETLTTNVARIPSRLSADSGAAAATLVHPVERVLHVGSWSTTMVSLIIVVASHCKVAAKRGAPDAQGVGSQVGVLDAILFQTRGRLCPPWHNRL